MNFVSVSMRTKAHTWCRMITFYRIRSIPVLACRSTQTRHRSLFLIEKPYRVSINISSARLAFPIWSRVPAPVYARVRESRLPQTRSHARGRIRQKTFRLYTMDVPLSFFFHSFSSVVSLLLVSVCNFAMAVDYYFSARRFLCASTFIFSRRYTTIYLRWICRCVELVIASPNNLFLIQLVRNR